VIADGPPETLGATAGATPTALVSFRAPAAEEDDLPVPADVERRDGRIAFRTPAPTRDLVPLVTWAADRGVELDGLTVTRPSLEDVYLELTEEASA
jgi:ABC-2 type transport system ATP-binding protein